MCRAVHRCVLWPGCPVPALGRVPTRRRLRPSALCRNQTVSPVPVQLSQLVLSLRKCQYYQVPSRAEAPAGSLHVPSAA